MKVKDLGESGLIDLIANMVEGQPITNPAADIESHRVLVTIGDDAAAACIGQQTELYTTDTLVEGVHFTETTASWEDLGWKAIASNISDIAAMGGIPMNALITLGLPEQTTVENIRHLYKGFIDIATEYNVTIIGGDVVRSPVLFITICMTGAIEREPMLRSAAQIGDMIGVTGYLGSSSGGLEVILQNLSLDKDIKQKLKTVHQRPIPRIPQGRILFGNGVRSAMDISDGLVQDLSKLCKASRVAATLDMDKIPIESTLRLALPTKYAQLALNGGEDYELLFTARQPIMEKVIPLLPQPAAIIGKVVEGPAGEVRVMDTAGSEITSISGGWDHFI